MADSRNRWILGDAFMRNVYTAFRYKPAAIGFGVLKPEYNWQTNIVPGSYGNVEGEAPAGGGSGSRDSDDHFSTLSVTRTPGPTAAATVANGASTLNVWKAATAVTVLVSSFLAL
jgi:hypothetical protein